jgi:hypothetical protein
VVAAHQSLPGGQDELYHYDPLHRLKDASRGDLDGAHTALTAVSLLQRWSLDSTGNWSTFQNFDAASGTNRIDQTRSHTKANAIQAMAPSSTKCNTAAGVDYFVGCAVAEAFAWPVV